MSCKTFKAQLELKSKRHTRAKTNENGNEKREPKWRVNKSKRRPQTLYKHKNEG